MLPGGHANPAWHGTGQELLDAAGHAQPPSQDAHAAVAPPDHVPAWHELHVDAADPANVPGAQDVQVLEPGGAYVPGVQAVHDDLPAAVVTYPPSHCVQEDDPAMEDVPAKHSAGQDVGEPPMQ